MNFNKNPYQISSLGGYVRPLHQGGSLGRNKKRQFKDNFHHATQVNLIITGKDIYGNPLPINNTTQIPSQQPMPISSVFESNVSNTGFNENAQSQTELTHKYQQQNNQRLPFIESKNNFHNNQQIKLSKVNRDQKDGWTLKQNQTPTHTSHQQIINVPQDGYYATIPRQNLIQRPPLHPQSRNHAPSTLIEGGSEIARSLVFSQSQKQIAPNLDLHAFSQPNNFSIEEIRYYERLKKASEKQKWIYSNNINKFSYESEKHKYAKQLESNINQQVTIPVQIQVGRKIPLGKLVSGVEMTNPEARRQLKEILEDQMKLKESMNQESLSQFQKLNIQQRNRQDVGQARTFA